MRVTRLHWFSSYCCVRDASVFHIPYHIIRKLYYVDVSARAVKNCTTHYADRRRITKTRRNTFFATKVCDAGAEAVAMSEGAGAEAVAVSILYWYMGRLRAVPYRYSVFR